MSKMFDYDNLPELFRLADAFDKVEDVGTQEYAMKYLFGLLDYQRRNMESLKARGAGVNAAQQRLKLLKRIIGTISSLPIPANDQPSRESLK